MDFLSSQNHRLNRNNSLISSRPQNDIRNSLVSRILSRSKKPSEIQLDEVIDINRDIDIFRENSLQLLNPRKLYSSGLLTGNSQLYKHYRETQVSVCRSQDYTSLNLIDSESMRQLKTNNMNLMHLGLLVIGIKGLTRKGIGCKTLITVFDSRWTDVKTAIIGMTEVDMNENRAIIYCSPDFMLNSREFGEHIKIGIQTKGYENMEGNNLLVCIGFLGKLAESSQTRYKLKTNKIVELMGNQGIKMIKPMYIPSEENAGLEWNLEKFVQKRVLVPESSLTYTNSRGEHTIRFTDYHYQNQNKDSEIESESNIETNLMNHAEIKILFPKELELRLSEKELLELEDTLYLQKQIKEDEELIYDSDKNIIIQKIKLEQPSDHINPLQELNDIELENIINYNLAGHEASSSSTPFSRITQTAPVTLQGGNVPRIPIAASNGNERDVKPQGKRMPLEKPIQFGVIGDGQVLNLSAHNPQRWTEIIGVWKNKIAGDYIRNFNTMDANEMYRYLETFLGETARAFWEAYKRDYELDFRQLVALGANPLNFGNKIQFLLTGEDPNSGTTGIQSDAILHLEQLSLYKWNYVIQFVQDYFYYTCISGNAFNQEYGEKLFRKLPGALGIEIAEKWKELPYVKDNPHASQSIGTRIQHVLRILKEKCTNIKIQKQLKSADYKFCKEIIYTPQHYGEQKINKRRPKRQGNKRYFIKKSFAKKPYLNKERHVRRYNDKRIYKNKLNCYSCGSEDHLATTCPSRINSKQKNSLLVNEINQDLIEIDEYVSDTESIYSIVSINLTNKADSSDSDDDLSFIDNMASKNLEEFRIREQFQIDGNYMNTEECHHIWLENQGYDNRQCFICGWYPAKNKRCRCEKCFKEICKGCLKKKYDIEYQEKNDSKIITADIKIIEKRVDLLELKLEKFELELKGKQKVPINEDIQTQLICNDSKDLTCIEIKCRIKLQGHIINCTAFVDPGSTKCIANSKIIPNQYRIKASNHTASVQMDGTYNLYNTYLMPAKISF